MIILDKPYVSHLLSASVQKLGVPVWKVEDVWIPSEEKLKVMKQEHFLQEFLHSSFPILFNSENGLRMLSEHAPDHHLSKIASVLKNKAEFRRILTNRFPEFFFREVSFHELESLDVNTLPFPIIVKPNIGYSSIGVYRVDRREDFFGVVEQLKQDMSMAGQAYPKEVLDSQTLIIEELIEGAEYAVDAYYTGDGAPVVLNLFKRMFSDDKDMSDRIYYTSKQVLMEALDEVQSFLAQIGPVFGIKSAPIHIELRRKEDGTIVPIEANPLRFAGIGTTELGKYAYGVNVYEYYFQQLRPDWSRIIEEMDDSIYSFCCAEFAPSIDCQAIESVDHEAFKAHFQEILEYRPMDFNKYTTFAVVFHKAPDLEENKRILQLDLHPFLKMKEHQMI
ncbi:ATP-grasp domain-containing protein [Bacillus xiapuensis]|uniref:ATP-grasp domain-containing protein n=1 Tax=Bacillus xiapuensis TaxID=2014075 RepID=UPI0012FE68D0|nr:ATP-grasp domain-containing protein [Bacillus xiapuensis]